MLVWKRSPTSCAAAVRHGLRICMCGSRNNRSPTTSPPPSSSPSLPLSHHHHHHHRTMMSFIDHSNTTTTTTTNPTPPTDTTTTTMHHNNTSGNCHDPNHKIDGTTTHHNHHHSSSSSSSTTLPHASSVSSSFHGFVQQHRYAHCGSGSGSSGSGGITATTTTTTPSSPSSPHSTPWIVGTSSSPPPPTDPETVSKMFHKLQQDLQSWHHQWKADRVTKAFRPGRPSSNETNEAVSPWPRQLRQDLQLAQLLLQITHPLLSCHPDDRSKWLSMDWNISVVATAVTPPSSSSSSSSSKTLPNLKSQLHHAFLNMTNTCLTTIHQTILQQQQPILAAEGNVFIYSQQQQQTKPTTSTMMWAPDLELQQQQLQESLGVVIQLTQQSHQLGLIYHWALYQKIIETIAQSSCIDKKLQRLRYQDDLTISSSSSSSPPEELARTFTFQTMMDQIICCTNIMGTTNQNIHNDNIDSLISDHTSNINKVDENGTSIDRIATTLGSRPTEEEEETPPPPPPESHVLESRNTALSSLFSPAYVALIRAEQFSETYEWMQFARDQYGLSIYDRDTTIEIYESIYETVATAGGGRSFHAHGVRNGAPQVRPSLSSRVIDTDDDDEYDAIALVVSMLEPSFLSFRPDWESETEAFHTFVNTLDLTFIGKIIDCIKDDDDDSDGDSNATIDNDNDGDEDEDDESISDDSDDEADDHIGDEDTDDEKRIWPVHGMITRRIQDDATKSMLEDIIRNSNRRFSYLPKKAPDAVTVRTPPKHGNTNIPAVIHVTIPLDPILTKSTVTEETSVPKVEQQSALDDDVNMSFDDTSGHPNDSTVNEHKNKVNDDENPKVTVNDDPVQTSIDAIRTVVDRISGDDRDDADDFHDSDDDMISDQDHDDDDRFPDVTCQFVELDANRTTSSPSPQRRRRRRRRRIIEFTSNYKEILWTQSENYSDDDDDDDDDDYDMYYHYPQQKSRHSNRSTTTTLDHHHDDQDDQDDDDSKAKDPDHSDRIESDDSKNVAPTTITTKSDDEARNASRNDNSDEESTGDGSQKSP